MQIPDWKSTAGDFTENLPRLAFPFEGSMPDVYVPQSTILQMPDDIRSHAWLWCYLERKVHGKRYLFNPSSLSAQRVRDLPRAVDRLSKRFRLDSSRPVSVGNALHNLSAFLLWLDDPLHHRRYEPILSDPDLALEALRKHHSYLRLRVQSNTANRFSQRAASNRDVAVIKTLSVVHDREYRNEIESIAFGSGEGVKAPQTEHVAAFMACCIDVFDSVVRIFLPPPDVEADSP
jgi:hypothetical protein